MIVSNKIGYFDARKLVLLCLFETSEFTVAEMSLSDLGEKILTSLTGKKNKLL